MRPLSLIRPPAWPLAAKPAAADSGSRELAAVVPHRVKCGCGVPARGRSVAGLVTMGNGEGCQAAVSASSPSSVRMWQACRTILRASDKAARLLFLRSLTVA